MLKKMKKMRHSTMASIITVLVFALFLTSAVAITSYNKSKAEPDGVINAPKTTKAAKVKKPAQVKGLKKVKLKTYYSKSRYISSAKITFKKVKGASGYQILIYDKKIKGQQTPLLYEKTTKKTTYTIKNLIPHTKYTIKVRAYIKDKKGKLVYGKATSIKVQMPGKVSDIKGFYYVCNHCVAMMPPTDDCRIDHMNSVQKVHGELHTSGTFNWK